MKKNFLFLATVTVLSSSILFSSCIGSFSLFNKLLAWNKTIDNKFVNEIIFIPLAVTAYPIAFIADILVLNSIEFWSGENPMEAGIIKNVQGENGIYTVETLENGYSIKNENGEEVEFIYDKENNTWSIVQQEESSKLFKYTEDSSIIVYLPDGKEEKVELTERGVLAFRQEMTNYYHLASR